MFANLAQIILNWNFANIFQLKVIFYGTGIFVNRWPTAITNLFTLNNAYKSTLPKCNFGQSYVCKLKGNFRLQFDAGDFLRLSYFDIWTWTYSIHKILIQPLPIVGQPLEIGDQVWVVADGFVELIPQDAVDVRQCVALLLLLLELHLQRADFSKMSILQKVLSFQNYLSDFTFTNFSILDFDVTTRDKTSSNWRTSLSQKIVSLLSREFFWRGPTPTDSTRYTWEPSIA